ncbi:MAG: YncE family protein [Ferruginibacter sp.]
MKNDFLKWLLPIVILLNACGKDDVKPITTVLTAAKGLYVLSEGGSDTKLGYYNLATGAFTGDFYRQQNSDDLGQTGNDMLQYGSKLYIVMNVSSNITVLNAANAALIKRIDFKTGSGAKKFPRYAIGYKNNIYVSSTKDSSVTVIDTASLSIVKTISVGPNPEGMAIVGNSLYVANSGGYNFIDGPDSTISVVNLSTQIEINRIKIGTKNPQKIEANSVGDLYVSGYGDFGAVPASVSVISSATNTVKKELGPDFPYAFVRICKDVAYFYNNYGGAGTSKVYNTITNALVRSEFVSDGTVITTPYGLNVDEQSGDVYINDAKDYTSSGFVTCFDKDGKKKFLFSVSPGVNPNKVLFIR